jgi:branched-chain amino acid transport system ATP-binding protein
VTGTAAFDIDPEPDAADAALELRNVHAAYGTITALRGVDLVVPYGKLVALLGPTGGGKSTTLRVISGLLPLTDGDLLVAGRRVNGAAPDALARRGVCLIPEGKGIFPNLSVRENLWMATHIGTPLNHIEEVAFARFPQLGTRRRQLAGTLSGGEQQMLAIGRALMGNPTLLLMDEPLEGLAPVIVDALLAGFDRLKREDELAMLLVEQHARLALEFAPETILLDRGVIVFAGASRELLEEPQRLAALMGVAAREAH